MPRFYRPPDSPHQSDAATSHGCNLIVAVVDWATAEPETDRKGLPTGQPAKQAKAKSRRR